MEENSDSGDNVDYWDGYDSDKDGEYVPDDEEYIPDKGSPSNSPKEVVTIKIRGKVITLPPLDLSLGSTSKDIKLTLNNNNKRARLMKENEAGLPKPSNQDQLEETPSTSMSLDRASVANNHKDVQAKVSKLAINGVQQSNKFDGEQEDALQETVESDKDVVGDQIRELLQDVPASANQEGKNIKLDQQDGRKSIENVEGGEETPLTEEARQKEKRLSRKRSRNPEKWVRKEKFDRGLEYVTSRKKIRPARKIETTKDCFDKCLYKCSRKIGTEDRNKIFSNFYLLNAREKQIYILNSTESSNPERRRKGKNSENSKKSKTFKYFFIINNNRIQVCKPFYCGTLAISQKPIYTAHKNSTESNTLKKSNQGKHKKKHTPNEAVNLVKEHIGLFPKVESHYCRADSKREYLEGDLSVQKMYDMYKDFVQEKGTNPVNVHTYRKIFCTEFNYSFNKPSKDRCDLCGEVDLRKKEKNLTEEKENEYKRHINEKELMREEKKRDIESGVPILCFDLENVITCPKGDLKNFFYKSKLNVYNMTAHLSLNRKVYCAIWSEAMRGRSGNDISSAVYTILRKVVEDYPLIEELILWSDSCVPQNRNSLMSYAIAYLIQTSKNLKKVTMKFSVPGHSCIQEVDSVHSSIERSLRKSEYFSPLSLLRLLLKVNTKKPYTLIQMQEKDFLDFNFYTSKLKYSLVPFAKVVTLMFTKSFFEVAYKTSFSEVEFTPISLRQRNSRKHVTADSDQDVVPKCIKKNGAKVTLGQNKVEALKSMYKWMPEHDKQFYQHIFANIPEKSKKK